ncbi:glutaredoxin domain-containing protein [Agromyces humatus]|uniref:Glutaredoxin-like protein NrdH n=1 Tax=Agromyces humatus TaxID=279573 RepID=A0ABP4X767_9MICO
MSITIYTGEGCRNCHRTMDVLTRKGIEFEAVDVATLPRAEADALRAQEFRQLPVVVVEGGDSWDGFRADKLVTLAAEAVAR